MKCIIIGGGIAGLTAGIYALQNGFETEIYEKNLVPGGECTGWERQGYTVDNCLHWLTGCRESDGIYALWQNIGAISDSTEFIREPFFYKLEENGTALHFWRDLEKARAEFLAVAPEDKEQLELFFDSVKGAECIKISCDKSLSEMSPFEIIRFGMSMSEMGKVMRVYGQESLESLAARFSNPLVKKMLLCFLPPCCKAIPLISSYAFYTSGTAAIPKGGSAAMVRRIVRRYESLGGKMHFGCPAERINIKDGTAQSVSFANGSTIPCDFVIATADPSAMFGKMLDEKYMDKALRKVYNSDKYHVFSQFNVSFGIIGDGNCGSFEGTTIFPCAPFTVGTSVINTLGVRLFDYDTSLFPADRRVLQCNILQNPEDYNFWQGLYPDRERYTAEKQHIADDVRARIVSFCPELDGRLIFLSDYSPVTFTKWCGAYKGSYMSFFEKSGSKTLNIKNTINGLGNVFIAGQWLTPNGGLPLAAISGRFAVNALLRAARKRKI